MLTYNWGCYMLEINEAMCEVKVCHTTYKTWSETVYLSRQQNFELKVSKQKQNRHFTNSLTEQALDWAALFSVFFWLSWDELWQDLKLLTRHAVNPGLKFCMRSSLCEIPAHFCTPCYGLPEAPCPADGGSTCMGTGQHNLNSPRREYRQRGVARDNFGPDMPR